MKPDPTGGPAAHPILDPAVGAGMIGRMMRRLIYSAMRSSLQELMMPALQEVNDRLHELKDQVHGLDGKVRGLEGQMLGLEGQLLGLEGQMRGLEGQMRRLEGQMHGLEGQVHGLNEEIKETNSCLRTGLQRLDGRIDALGERLDKRIDELALQQGRMVEEVAALKRDRDSAGDLVHRITRIEDRVFARAV